MKIKIGKLDKLFSLYIRSRAHWTCELCGHHYPPPTNALHCSHFYGRRKKSVRWDIDNAAALCMSCHLWMGEHPYEHTEWFKKRLGPSFDFLLVRANDTNKGDLKLIEIYLKSMVAGVKEPGIIGVKA